MSFPNFTVPGLLFRPPSDQDNLTPNSISPPSYPNYTGSFGYSLNTHPVSPI